jgi:hypothetical protein
METVPPLDDRMNKSISSDGNNVQDAVIALFVKNQRKSKLIRFFEPNSSCLFGR